MRRPSVELRPGWQLADADIDAMIELRAGMIAFKRSADRVLDRSKFRSFVHAADRVLRMHDDHGRLAGMISVELEDGQHLGQRYRMIMLEYGFVLPRYRGHAIWTLGYLSLFANMLAWDPRVNNFCGGVGYLHSVLRLTEFCGELWIEGEPNQPPLHRHVLTRLRGRFPGEAGDIIELPTRAGPPSQAWLERNRDRPEYRRYVERVPNWYEGYGLPCLTTPDPYRPGNLLRPFARSLRRSLG